MSQCAGAAGTARQRGLLRSQAGIRPGAGGKGGAAGRARKPPEGSSGGHSGDAHVVEGRRNKCCICQEARDDTDKGILSCGHEFCFDCIAQAFIARTKAGHACQCPLCHQSKVSPIVTRETLVRTTRSRKRKAQDISEEEGDPSSSEGYAVRVEDKFEVRVNEDGVEEVWRISKQDLSHKGFRGPMKGGEMWPPADFDVDQFMEVMSDADIDYVTRKAVSVHHKWTEDSQMRKFRRLQTVMDTLTAQKEYCEVERIKEMIDWPEPGVGAWNRTHHRGHIDGALTQQWVREGKHKHFHKDFYDRSHWTAYQFMDAELLCDQQQTRRLKRSTRDLLYQHDVNCVLTSAWRP
ncbi:unnamed protein product [Vitrella brassicaformis CCMP3155]|uniref:RING-type domain-containing protein n=1 Tax=Vitrella brassicaformis (strain CCMP3155) TaxID=1169540 RepID=A0A0G4G5T4_VITBC|nr:unnamed protein product [Vitrella brassicaformis CCMP3155]|eukprot:CEM23851.1 unnamed protein product [Vitrella brassicaformis CCMP3155]